MSECERGRGKRGEANRTRVPEGGREETAELENEQKNGRKK